METELWSLVIAPALPGPTRPASHQWGRDSRPRRFPFLKALGCLAFAALLLLTGGCANPQMKGTPFFSGEYGTRKGPVEKRMNFWPLYYYRDPALSVLWPAFEWTDDHTAVRPLFSVYGLDRTNQQYNVLWPLAQVDRQTGNNRVFPVFWGEDHRVLFPLYWHSGEPFAGKAGHDAVFPLYVLRHASTNESSLFTPWPLVYNYANRATGEGRSMVFPCYWWSHDEDGSLLLSPLWMSGTDLDGSHWRSLLPLFYQTSNRTSSAFATLVWAQGRSESKDWRAVIPLCYWDNQKGTLLSPLWATWQYHSNHVSFAPWSLSWMTSRPNRRELWLAAGLAHVNAGEKPGPHHVVPFYFRNAEGHILLTPLCGWNHDGGDFCYPFTPLAGVRTDHHRGSWVFPLYSHARPDHTNEVFDRYLLFGGYHAADYRRHYWFCPVFSFHDNGPLDSMPKDAPTNSSRGKRLLCLPFTWYRNESHLRPTRPAPSHAPEPQPAGPDATGPVSAPDTNAPPVIEYVRKHGSFPFWRYSRRVTPALESTSVGGSVGVVFYDYKHGLGPATVGDGGGTNDYTRARVLWRLWHYEKRNGDVSIDVFPTITHDHKTNGYQRTSFLGRCFRYERSPEGKVSLDLMFIPLRRPPR